MADGCKFCEERTRRGFEGECPAHAQERARREGAEARMRALVAPKTVKPRGVKRRAEVPYQAVELSWKISKADLLEAAWGLAGLCNDTGMAEDDEATFRRLIEEINAWRANRGDRKLSEKLVEKLRAGLVGAK